MYYYGSYWLIVIVSLVLGLATQGYINRQYKVWSKVRLSSGETGAQVAQRMLAAEGASQVGIVRVGGHLTDFYDPRDNRLHLSDENLSGGSVASAAVACHEAGHAVQHAQGYVPVKIRTALVPVVNFTSNVWMVLLMLGMFVGSIGLARLAVLLFGFSVLFQLITLPVEFDASRRAVQYLSNGAGLSPEAEEGARKVLTAAALTYVAAALVSILQLLYYLGLTSDRR